MSDRSGPPEEAQAEAFRLAGELIRTLDAIRSALPPPAGGIGQRLRRHLGTDARRLPGVVERLPTSERVNLQVALDDLQADATEWELIGLQSDIGNFGGFSITSLVGGRFGGHVDEQPVEYTRLPVSYDEELPCFRAGLILTEHDDARMGVLVYTVERGMSPEILLEVVATREAAAHAFVARLKDSMRSKNVFRGKTISFSWNQRGDFGLEFTRLPPVTRADVILPERDLAAVEEHTIGMTTHAAALRSRGQHLRRGLLLYGPPGTGKTHTVSYLCGQLEGRTVLLLAGAALNAFGRAAALARELSPAMIVIEDVDLIGMDRSLPGGEHNPLLFQLLNEMDGMGDDRDVIFVLTTNRVDMLEPALTARPGRIDRAIEIGLPDEEARLRLLHLYLPEPVEDEVLDRVVARTRGAAAAFIKELSRRAVLVSVASSSSLAIALPQALDEMLEHAPPILRRSLGVAGA